MVITNGYMLNGNSMAIISLRMSHPDGSSHRLTRSPDGTIGGDEVSKLVQALDTKNFWTQVPVDASWCQLGYSSLNMGMDQYLLIPFLGEWTSIYQLFWCELQGYKVLTHCHMVWISHMLHVWYFYLQNWVIFRANVGQYSSTMEHMGMGKSWVHHGRIWVNLITTSLRPNPGNHD